MYQGTYGYCNKIANRAHFLFACTLQEDSEFITAGEGPQARATRMSPRTSRVAAEYFATQGGASPCRPLLHSLQHARTTSRCDWCTPPRQASSLLECACLPPLVALRCAVGMDAVVSERSHVVVLKGDQSQTNLPQPSTRKLATHGDPVAVKRAKSKSKVPQASMRELFQFASAGDWALIIIAAIGSLACGACMPLLIYFFSASIETIGQTSSSNSFDMNEGAAQAISMVLTGVAFWATTALYMAAMDIAKTRQIAKYKKAYLKSIVRQDVGWFDVNSPQTLASKIGESIVLIEEGISNKFIQFFENLGTGLGCFVLAMYYAWDVALVVVATMPIVALAGVLLNHVQQNSQRTIGAAYATAGGVASEALYSIRTVAAFGLEKRLHSLYKASLAKAEKAAIRESWLAGFAFSTFLASPFLMIAVGLYYGGAILYLGRKDRFRREHTPEPPHVTPAATPPFALLSPPLRFPIAQRSPSLLSVQRVGVHFHRFPRRVRVRRPAHRG